MNERYHSQQDNYSWHTEDLASRDFQDWFILSPESQLLLSGINKTSFVDVQVSIFAPQAGYENNS